MQYKNLREFKTPEIDLFNGLHIDAIQKSENLNHPIINKFDLYEDNPPSNLYIARKLDSG